MKQIDKLKEEINKIDFEEERIKYHEKMLNHRIDYEIDQIFYILQPFMKENFPQISNSKEFLDKYDKILVRCVASVAFYLNIGEFSGEQISYIYGELNNKFNEMYDMLIEEYEQKLDDMNR